MSATLPTAQQARVLELIRASVRARGFPPSVSELAEALRVASANTVREILLYLEKKGLIVHKQVPGRVRARQLGIVGEAIPLPTEGELEAVAAQLPAAEARCLVLVVVCTREANVPPSLRELARAYPCSRRTIRRLLAQLEAAGYLQGARGRRARAWRVRADRAGP